MALPCAKCPSSSSHLPSSPPHPTLPPSSRCRAASSFSSLDYLSRCMVARGVTVRPPRDRNLCVLCGLRARRPSSGGLVATTAPAPSPKGTPARKSENRSLTTPLSSKEEDSFTGFTAGRNESTVSITVVGASSDLAKKKIFPSLFALYYECCLPEIWCQLRHEYDV